MSLAADVHPTVRRAIRCGDEAIRDHDPDSAAAHYREALDLSPDNPDALIGLEYADYLRSKRPSRFDFGLSPSGAPQTQLKEENQRQIELDFRSGTTVSKGFPVNGFFEHTTRCNFYCPHCTKGYDPYFAQELPRDRLNATLEELLPRLKWACITGFGEPTIGERYPELMRKLVGEGVRPHFNTNTSTLTLPHIEALVKCNAHVTLSVDGATKETFETIRAGGSWEKLIYSLHAIRRIRAILAGGSSFEVTFVAMRKNIDELPEMVRLVHRFDLDLLRVQDYYFYDIEYDNQSLRYEPERANRRLEEAEQVARDLGVALLIPPRYSMGSPDLKASLWKKALTTRRIFPARKRFPQSCKSPWQEVKILVDGRVAPCCFSDTGMGNIQKDSFEKIWNGIRYRFFRWRIRTIFPPRECRVCHSSEGINKGNPANVLLKEGLLVKVFYYLEHRIQKWFYTRRKKGEVKNYYKGKWLRPNPAVQSRSE